MYDVPRYRVRISALETCQSQVSFRPLWGSEEGEEREVSFENEDKDRREKGDRGREREKTHECLDW